MKKLNIGIRFLPNYKDGIGYADAGASGLDLTAGIEEDLVIEPGKHVIVPLGVSMEIPAGYEGQVRGRSGFAAKNCIGVVNGIGTIDSSFRGEIAAILINWGSEPFTVAPGMRVAQIVFNEICRAQLTRLDSLGYSARGEVGYGSSGSGPLPFNPDVPLPFNTDALPGFTTTPFEEIEQEEPVE